MSLLVQIVPPKIVSRSNVSSPRKKRRSIELPEELEQQITALAGRRGRAAFIREAVRQEIERRRLLASVAGSKESRNGAVSRRKVKL
jgi:metal-responsive CopG/Arc/MetJ family transcriptional regulator